MSRTPNAPAVATPYAMWAPRSFASVCASYSQIGLVELRQRQDDVARRPHGRAEQETEPNGAFRQRRRDDPVLHAPQRPVAPVHDVVHERCPLRIELPLQEPLDEPLSDLTGGGDLVPVRLRGELPLEERALASVAPVPGVPHPVHRDGSDRAGKRTARDSAEWRHLRSPHRTSLSNSSYPSRVMRGTTPPPIPRTEPTMPSPFRDRARRRSRRPGWSGPR
ncbi:MAG: hypothetical protein JWL83_1090 [Actinomycetia bacterium]|nr:hypothetical protein [Actinomycetes bacterium]